MSAPHARRGFLLGLASLPLVGGSVVTAQAFASQPQQDNDTRLVELADAMEAIELACNVYTAAHRGRETKESEDEFHEIVEGFAPFETEMAETPADTMVGVLAKARALQIPTVRGCATDDLWGLMVDDLVRLYAAGASA